MGGDQLGTADGLNAQSARPEAAPARSDRPKWDRYAHWGTTESRIALAILAALLVLAALVPVHEQRQSGVQTVGFVENLAGKEPPRVERDADLKLYHRAIDRIAAGEHYYDFIFEEHRAANYPVRPGLAVRLPTLAYINAAIGETGQTVLAVLLMLAVLVAWWRRLSEDSELPRRVRTMAMAFLFVGASLGTNKHFFVLHELWAGMLLALAFALHRPGRKWGAALFVAALALAIRELALPFVLLLAAMAFWRRDWKEGAAWTALIAIYVVALAWHLSIIAANVLPTDPYGQGWLYLRGLAGWVSNVALSSNLRFLPGWLAAPVVILMAFGWTAWRSPAGTFGTFLYLGYGLAFMLAGRPDNYYWGVAIAPAMFVGLAFVPQGLRSLIAAAQAKRLRASYG